RGRFQRRARGERRGGFGFRLKTVSALSAPSRSRRGSTSNQWGTRVGREDRFKTQPIKCSENRRLCGLSGLRVENRLCALRSLCALSAPKGSPPVVESPYG